MQSTVATHSVGFTVADLEKSRDFYTQVLGFEVVSDRIVSGAAFEQLYGCGSTGRIAQLQLGDEILELTQFSDPGKPIPADTRSCDRTFQHFAIVVSDMAKAYAHLQQHLVQSVSTQPQTLPAWNEAVAGIQAFYFQDPDGHNLELIAFPPDKGNPKWQRATTRLILGIDHTAVVVANTETSLELYQLLGLVVKQQTHNYGREQEHLSAVAQAEVKITRLDPSQGFGVELIEYLTPTDGRPMPRDLRPNDLLHWQSTFMVRDAIPTIHAALTQPIAMVSTGIGTPQEIEFQQGVLLRDSDGHRIRIVEQPCFQSQGDRSFSSVSPCSQFDKTNQPQQK